MTLLAAATASFYLKVLPLSWIYDSFLPLLTAASTITALLVIGLYISSFCQSKVLASGGNTDSGIYNFFIGRELNPRIGTFDLKHFCELYPGLIGWLVIDLGMLQKQYEKHGSVSTSMALVCVFHFVYVLDALWFEPAILSTMDIVHDGFGFMLAYGDLVWVPFTYSLQARYLVDHPQVRDLACNAFLSSCLLFLLIFLSSGTTPCQGLFLHTCQRIKTMQTLPSSHCCIQRQIPGQLSTSVPLPCMALVNANKCSMLQALSYLALLAILCLKVLGYCAFRGANSQKDTFRRDPTHPSVRNLQTLKTERGTRLITSGWWGVARHINYTGDWLMA